MVETTAPEPLAVTSPVKDEIVPAPTGGTVHVPSAFKNLPAAASPAAGAGAMPLVPPEPVSPITAGSMASVCAAVRSCGLAVAPVLLPLIVKVGIWPALALVTALSAIVAGTFPGPFATTSVFKLVMPKVEASRAGPAINFVPVMSVMSETFACPIKPKAGKVGSKSAFVKVSGKMAALFNSSWVC